MGGTATIGLALGNPAGGSASGSVAAALQAAGSPPTPMTFLYSSPGDDALAATAGPDRFVFLGAAFGHDVVSGFDPAQDVIQLSRAQFADFAIVQNDLSQGSGSGALITLDGANSILLQGVNPASLQAGNFRFA